MARFNKFATRSANSVSGGGSSIYPLFNADSSYKGPSTAVAGSDGSSIGGFSNDSDYIVLPTTSGDTLDYFDNTGTQIVTNSWAGGLAVTEINAA